MTPTVVELFAGAGGAALGLQRAGLKHLACLELDPDACATLRAAGLPCVEGDVRDPALYDPSWGGCDLLWSSFPCQAWSNAGKRQGAKDERNGWPWTVDAIDRLQPKWFAAENVVGLTNHRGGCEGACLGPDLCPRAYFERVILEQLRIRFQWVSHQVINASSLGIPQHRRRIIILAGPSPVEFPKPTHGRPTAQADLFGHNLTPWVTVGEALGLVGWGSATTRQGSAPAGVMVSADVPACAPVAGGNALGGLYGWEKGEHPELLDSPSPAVCATEYKGTNGKESTGWTATGGPARASDALWRATGRRRLTVEECAVLQGLEGHPIQGATLASKYRQVGNAVPPAMAEAVGRSILRSTGHA